ncbi:MAG: Dolichol-phosphate mannosyltransferase [Ignavibacteriae bacterium]|nr:MAG: Dolichol-phosphate mannosyltransferase [Ignavibacteriota bacterium]
MVGFETVLSFFFVLSVIIIWFMIAYQFGLTVFGFKNYVKSLKEKEKIDRNEYQFPTCSILIPAHNEEKVIGKTLEAMMKLNYPKDKLKIIVINDGSTDRTGEITHHYAKLDSRITLYNIAKGEGGKGKSRALNIGVKQTDSEIIAIYDADNTPDKNALRYLVVQLLTHKELGAAIGKFRTVNKNRNILTKFINIETLSFQSMLQAGRWEMHGIATLPGTNLVIWSWLIERLNGWDEEALTEDSELSIRIYKEGYKIKFVPYAITYEQEPEKWSVWVRQRIRWVRGNNYVIAKFFKQIPSFKNKRLAFDVLYTLSLYYLFFIAILISDLIFLSGVFNLVSISVPGPYTLIWIIAFILFIFEIMFAISFDSEDSSKKVLLIILMYFTYCQLWIYIVIRAVYLEYIKKEKRVWDKTIRFETEITKTSL